MADEEKVRIWEARVRRWQSSGLTAAAFAAREGVGVSSLGVWSRRLAAQKRDLGGVGLARVEVARAEKKPSRAALRLELRAGVAIFVDEDTDLDFLALVLGVLGKAS